jgi:Tfp pilus assembly PilM family ATPase
LHNEFAAIVAAHPPAAMPTVDPAACTMIVDLGANSCRIAFAHGRELEYARTVAVGGRRLDEMIARQLDIDLSEAHRQRMGIADFGSTGESCTREDGSTIVGINLSEPLAILTDEFEMCLRFFTSQQAGRRVREMVFFGGEARHTPICHYVARKLRLTAHVADPCARFSKTGKEPCVGVDLKQPQPGWAVAVGLCLSPTDL